MDLVAIFTRWSDRIESFPLARGKAAISYSSVNDVSDTRLTENSDKLYLDTLDNYYRNDILRQVLFHYLYLTAVSAGMFLLLSPAHTFNI